MTTYSTTLVLVCACMAYRIILYYATNKQKDQFIFRCLLTTNDNSSYIVESCGMLEIQGCVGSQDARDENLRL